MCCGLFCCIVVQSTCLADDLAPFPVFRDALAHWRTYFYFKLAEHSMMHEGQDAATDQLHLLDNQGLTHAERVLHLLCRATLHLCACEPTAAAAIVEELSPLIEKAGQGNSLLHKQLRCHYSVLYIAMVVAAGRVNDLKQGERMMSVDACVYREGFFLPFS